MDLDAHPAALGRYEIIGRLATGGMAEILLGRLTGPSGFARAVAIKRILPGYASHKSFVDMFLDEARIAARINHPNVVSYEELSRDDGQLFVVMEYLEGESLASLQRRARSRRRPIDHGQACYVVSEAAAGLHAAHEMCDFDGAPLGIVHRDISPQNVFVTYDGTVKLMDFGIAKAANRITATEAGALKGKFAYMSPEQAEGEELDRRSDVFSLGILLYELLTGRRLFRRATPTASLRAVKEAKVAAPSSIAPGCPAELDAICLRALARDVADRYPTAEALRLDLLKVLRRLSEGDPGLALKETMLGLFPDRRDEKSEMLRQVAVGREPSQLPEPEVDFDDELPSVELPDEASTVIDRPSPRGSGWRVAASIAVAGLALLGVAAGGWALLEPDDSPARAASTVSAASPPPAPRIPAARPRVEVAATPEAEEEPPPAHVSITVESEPEGARVLVAGVERGTTPTTLELPRAEDAISLRLEREGHRPEEAELVPDVDQRMRFVLTRRRVRRGARRSARTASPPPAETSSSASREEAFPIF